MVVVHPLLAISSFRLVFGRDLRAWQTTSGATAALDVLRKCLQLVLCA
jgi:hypothetical protein